MVMPPPFAKAALVPADHVGTGLGGTQRSANFKDLSKDAVRINGVDLVSKATNVSSQCACETACSRHMAESTTCTLISPKALEHVVCELPKTG